MTDTRVNLFTNPAFTATRTPLVVARNLFTNPVLGNATPELNWTHNAGGATVVTSVMSSGGVDAAVPFRRMHFNTDSTSTGTFGQFVGSTTSNAIPATAGLAYATSVYVRHNLAAARNYQCILAFYNISNTFVGQALSTAVLVQPNIWTRITINSVAPANTVRLTVSGYVNGAATANNGVVPAGSDLDMTMPNVDQSVAVQEFFSGGSTGPDYVYAWTGAAHGSTSTKSAGAVVATNLCTNPGAETATGWTSNNGSVCPADRDTAVKHSGTQSCRGTVVSGNSLLTIYAVGFATGVAGYGPATVGRWYTASLWFYTNEANVLHQVQIRFVDGAYASVGGAYSANVALPAGVWTKATVSLVAPTGAVYVGMSAFVTKAGATPGMNAWADDACLQEGVGTDTFNGNTASDADFVYAWTGTPDASTSVKMAKKLVSPSSLVGNAYQVASSVWPGHPQALRLMSSYSVSNGSGYVDISNSAGGPAGILARGVPYTVSCRVWVDPSFPVAAGANPGLNYSESGTGVTGSSNLPVGSSGEQNLSLSFTPTVGAENTSFRVRLYNGHITGASSVWCDDLIVEANPPAATETIPRQEGKNWVANPYFDVSTTGWSVASQVVLTRDTAEFHTAFASMRIDMTRPGGHVLYGAATNSSLVATPSFPVGTQLRWRVWVKANRSGVVQIWPIVNSTAYLVTPSFVNVNVTTSWQEVVIAWTADRIITNAYVIVSCNTETSNITVWIDDVSITDLVPAYFNGNTIRANGYDYSWSGTADASTSIAAPTTTGSAPLTLDSGSAAVCSATGSAPLILGSGVSAAAVTGSAPLSLTSGSSAALVARGSAPLELASGSAVRVTGGAPLRFESGGSAVRFFTAMGSAPLCLGASTLAYWVLDPFGLDVFLGSESTTTVVLDPESTTAVVLDQASNFQVQLDQPSAFEITVQR